MAKAFRPPRRKPLTLQKQAAFVRLMWRDLECRIHRNKKLVCEGWLQPDSTCTCYLVRITLQSGGKRPSVRVIEPPLCRRKEDPDAEIPHVFDENTDPEPCLYWKGQWRPSQKLAETIIPWLLEWLLFYEIWHVTGEWYGRGIEHRPEPKELA